MQLFLRLGFYCALVNGAVMLALGVPGLLPTTGRWVPCVTYIGLLAGFIGTLVAKQLLGKSDELRSAGGVPADRVTDDPLTPATRPAIKIPIDGPKMLLPWLAFAALALCSCVHLPSAPPSPSQQQFTAAFEGCLKSDGIQDLGAIGIQAFNLLNGSAGATAVQILQRLEALGVQDGALVVSQIVNCAAQSWLNLNPVGTGAQPTAPQGGARLYLVRHLKRPTVPVVH